MEKEILIKIERENQRQILLLEIERNKYLEKDHPNSFNLKPYHKKLKEHGINIQNFHGGSLVGMFKIIIIHV